MNIAIQNMSEVSKMLDACYCLCCFQAIREALDTLQPSVESAQQHKDVVLSNANPEDVGHVQQLMTELQAHWNRVNTQYTERHR